MKPSEKIEEILHDIGTLDDKEQLEILEKLICNFEQIDIVE